MFIFPGLIQSLLYFYCYDILHYRAIALTDCQEVMVTKFALHCYLAHAENIFGATLDVLLGSF